MVSVVWPRLKRSASTGHRPMMSAGTKSMMIASEWSLIKAGAGPDLLPVTGHLVEVRGGALNGTVG